MKKYLIVLAALSFVSFAVSCTPKENPETAVSSVSLNQTELALEEGQTAQLTATVKPDNATDKAVSWSSSKPAVASVDQSGNVTAVKAGIADITVKTNSGGKTAACRVTVASKIPATGVSVNPASLSLAEGESATLSAVFKPEDANTETVEWKSSNTSVATVDASGKVTGVKSGTANITVKTSPGGFTATCAVKVFVRKNYVFRVGINGGTFEEAKSEYTYAMLPPGSYSGVQRFLFIVCEGNATTAVHDSEKSHYAISIISQNPSGTITTALNGQEAYGGTPKYYTPWVYPEKAGTATVKVSYEDGTGNAISKEIKFTITATAAKSISLGCNEFVLGAGNTRQMKAAFTPTDASFQDVTWSSTNTSVAKVSSSGLVTAVAKGEAQIKAVNSEGIEGKAKIIVWPQPNAVDLGLSVLWADRNLGAESTSVTTVPPYCFFAWSETAPEILDGKFTNSLSKLTYWDPDKKLTKYCLRSADGVVDNRSKLQAMDDAASVILGNGWRMPTVAEVMELHGLNFTQRMASATATTPKMYYVRFPASNGKYIDLPMWAARGSNTIAVGYLGFYWTSELTGGTGTNADAPKYLYLENQGSGSNQVYVYPRSDSSNDRTSGLCIRPVKNK